MTRRVKSSSHSQARRDQDIDRAKALLKQCVAYCPPGTSTKLAIREAAKRTGLPYARTRGIWYGEARRIEASEMDRLSHVARYTDMAQLVASMERLKPDLAATLPQIDGICANLVHALRTMEASERYSQPAHDSSLAERL